MFSKQAQFKLLALKPFVNGLRQGFKQRQPICGNMGGVFEYCSDSLYLSIGRGGDNNLIAVSLTFSYMVCEQSEIFIEAGLRRAL